MGIRPREDYCGDKHGGWASAQFANNTTTTFKNIGDAEYWQPEIFDSDDILDKIKNSLSPGNKDKVNVGFSKIYC